MVPLWIQKAMQMRMDLTGPAFRQNVPNQEREAGVGEHRVRFVHPVHKTEIENEKYNMKKH
jgi:hypothetical protein